MIRLLFQDDLWEEFLDTFSEVGRAALTEDPEYILKIDHMPIIHRLTKKGYLDFTGIEPPNKKIKKIIAEWQFVIRHPHYAWWYMKITNILKKMF